MANSYITNTQIQALMPDESWGTAYDSYLTTLAERASRILDRVLRVAPGAWAVGSTESRYYDGSGQLELFVDPMCALPTSVSVAETGVIDGAGGTGGTYTAWSTIDYLVEPANWSQAGQPIRKLTIDIMNGSKTVWYGWKKAVKIVGYFGMASSGSTPPEIVQATGIQAMRYFMRGRQAFQDVGAIEQLRQLRYVQTLDPDIIPLVEHLKEVVF